MQHTCLLAQKGSSNNSIQSTLLQQDIDNVLSSCRTNSSIKLAIYQNQPDLVLCKSWISNAWHETKHFVKKHKKAILIGAAVLVGAAVLTTVLVVAAGTKAAAAIATTTAAGATSAFSQDEKSSSLSSPFREEVITKIPSVDFSQNNEATPSLQPIALDQVIEENTADLKNTLLQETAMDQINSIQTESFLIEKVRQISSGIIHEILEAGATLGSVFPEFTAEIKEVGPKLIPESLISNIPDDQSNSIFCEQNPVENYNNSIFYLHKKIDDIFETNFADKYSPETKKVRDKIAIGILPPPGTLGKIPIDTSKLIEAGKIPDRIGLTRAGRGLMKHGNREGSVFPKPQGNTEQVNRQGLAILEGILSDPNKQVYELPNGNLKIYSSDGRGAFFTKDGRFRGFIEQQYE